MLPLITWILKWLGRKLMVLLCIIGIMLVAAWFQRQWSRILEMRKDADAVGVKVVQKKSHLDRLHERMKTLGVEAEKTMMKLKDLDSYAALARQAEIKAKAEHDRLVDEIGWWPDWTVPLKAKARDTAKEAYTKAKKIARSTQANADKFRRAQNNSELSQLQSEIDMTNAEINESESRRTKLLNDAEKEPLQRIVSSIHSVLPAATWVLVGVIIVPACLKAFLFFIVAPLASRMPPIHILQKKDDAGLPIASRSGVSLEIMVQPGEELLIHPDYLQSTSKPSPKRTQWFLDHRIPFTSLASHMVMLTRIRPVEHAPTKVLVSPQHDPLGEVGTIELPDGASMVVLPRSLAGIVKPQGGPSHITRHWRLGSLHSWLTFQFRFLVFHGPCKLILKGCRGVCAECPEVDNPRLINQSATIGFSANLDYSNTRCETFISYLRGKEDLFNDLFGGGPGLFVYEEMPDVTQKSGMTGRGLEGVLDGMLKAFGI